MRHSRGSLAGSASRYLGVHVEEHDQEGKLQVHGDLEDAQDSNTYEGIMSDNSQGAACPQHLLPTSAFEAIADRPGHLRS